MIRAVPGSALAILLFASGAAAQVPWHPSLGIGAGTSTLDWARSSEAGPHVAAELTVPLGPYLGVRGSLGTSTTPTADTTMSHQRVQAAEVVARLRVASWWKLRAWGELGLAHVRVSDDADWADATGTVQRMRVERTGNMESVGAAVSFAVTPRLTVEARTRRLHGVINRMTIDGVPNGYFETNSLRMYRLEFGAQWRL